MLNHNTAFSNEQNMRVSQDAKKGLPFTISYHDRDNKLSVNSSIKH